MSSFLKHFLCFALLVSGLFGLPTAPNPESKVKDGATQNAGDRSRPGKAFKTEVQTLVNLLEHIHYNRESVRAQAFPQIINEFMGDIDGQRLFFLTSDRQEFETRYSKVLYYNLKEVGSVDAAFDIFERYEHRVKSRLQWIFQTLQGDFDFTVKDYYRLDRSKSDWPDSSEASDLLWQKRLKFELISELLNKKTPVEAKEIVRKRYERMLKNVAEIDSTEIAEIFLSSYTKLYDPHSTYFSADTFEDFSINMRLQLIGVGAVLGIEEDTCVVKEIVPGGPADLDNQLRPNDKILAVAQGDLGEPVDIIGMKLRKIVSQIRGAKGTKVRLLVQPAKAIDSSTRREIVIMRDVVKLNSSRAFAGVFHLPADQEGQAPLPIGVVSLPSFYGGEDESSGERISCTKDVAELIRRLKKENIQGLVLDLRRNGGGLLSEAIDLTGLFIKTGPVVQVRDFRGAVDVATDDDGMLSYEGPLAVLTDRFSASASEIVAGALQNYGRAIVIGDSSTHGKGSVQNVIELQRFMPPRLLQGARTGAAKLTIQKFYLPSGASTQLKGVIPDIVLKSFEDFLPIGESDLSRALIWDEIPSSQFSGSALSSQVLVPLREASLERQAKLEEFQFHRDFVDWFKARQEQKLISLNLDERLQQKANDETHRKNTKERRKELEKGAFTFKEIRLVPPSPSNLKAQTKEEGEGIDDFEDEADKDAFAKLDIQLREALRVLGDALDLGKDPQRWNHAFVPLSAGAQEKATGS